MKKAIFTPINYHDLPEYLKTAWLNQASVERELKSQTKFGNKVIVETSVAPPVPLQQTDLVAVINEFADLFVSTPMENGYHQMSLVAFPADGDPDEDGEIFPECNQLLIERCGEDEYTCTLHNLDPQCDDYAILIGYITVK